MSSKIRECVKALNQGKNVNTLLPEYVRQSLQLHAGYAGVKLMMEYYIFYEMISEGINPYIDSAKDVADELNRVIGEYLDALEKGKPGDTNRLESVLLGLRREVTERMNVLTAYVDQFVIYEYVLNRLQYRFEDQEVMPEDSTFVQQVIQFVFGTKDNVVINDHIRSVMGQLPMRMTRTHYFDLVRDSLTVYKDSDRSSLEGFLYQFRTNAMLYRTEGMKEHFTEFIPVLEELASVDYDKLSGEAYEIYAEKIKANASRLNDISDLYLLLAQIINEMYSLVLASEQEDSLEKIPSAKLVLRGINELFAGKSRDTEEETLCQLGEHFSSVEGLQETLYESISLTDAILSETAETQKEAIQELNLTEEFNKLMKLEQLTSNSTFAELEQNRAEEKVSGELLEQETGKLVTELKELLKNSDRMVRRAIMANTLEKIPVFFKTPQEVADYFTQSLMLCEDDAEKHASKELIQSLME